MVVILSIILLLTPIVIYYKYGREPKLYHSQDFKTDLPFDDSLVFVNAIIPENIKLIKINGFHVTILDLIDIKYIKVVTSLDDDILLEIMNIGGTNLQCYEQDILTFFDKFKDQNNNVLFTKITKKSNPVKFQKFLKQ